MHLQENILFGHMKCCPVPSSSCDLKGVKKDRSALHCKISKHLKRKLCYLATKLEVATSKCIGGDAFTRKFNI